MEKVHKNSFNSLCRRSTASCILCILCLQKRLLVFLRRKKPLLAAVAAIADEAAAAAAAAAAADEVGDNDAANDVCGQICRRRGENCLFRKGAFQGRSRARNCPRNSRL